MLGVLKSLSMKDQELNKVVQIIDEVIDEFKENPEIIFEDDKERKILKYDSSLLQTFKPDTKKCIYKGCEKLAIENSHTIQKSTSIKLISENGHVLEPQADRKTGQVKISKIGINKASTFPGFCRDHERLFNKFEHARELSGSMDFILQIYRTVCREIILNQTNLNALKARKKQYLDFRNSKLRQEIETRLGDDFFDEDDSIKNFKFKNKDYRLSTLDEKINSIEGYLSGFLNEFHDQILKDLDISELKSTAIVVADLDIQLPVCLAGKGNFQFDSKSKHVNTIINVLPYEERTYVIMSSFKKHEQTLENYLQYFSCHPLTFISMIESWMVYGSDHWFIQPSTWKKIEPNYQQKIVDDLYDFSKNIIHEYEHSIFNDVKIEIINGMLASIDQVDPKAVELLKKEIPKLTCSNSILYP